MKFPGSEIPPEIRDVKFHCVNYREVLCEPKDPWLKESGDRDSVATQGHSESSSTRPALRLNRLGSTVEVKCDFTDKTHQHSSRL